MPVPQFSSEQRQQCSGPPVCSTACSARVVRASSDPSGSGAMRAQPPSAGGMSSGRWEQLQQRRRGSCRPIMHRPCIMCLHYAYGISSTGMPRNAWAWRTLALPRVSARHVRYPFICSGARQQPGVLQSQEHSNGAHTSQSTDGGAALSHTVMLQHRRSAAAIRTTGSGPTSAREPPKTCRLDAAIQIRSRWERSPFKGQGAASSSPLRTAH